MRNLIVNLKRWLGTSTLIVPMFIGVLALSAAFVCTEQQASGAEPGNITQVAGRHGSALVEPDGMKRQGNGAAGVSGRTLKSVLSRNAEERSVLRATAIEGTDDRNEENLRSAEQYPLAPYVKDGQLDNALIFYLGSANPGTAKARYARITGTGTATDPKDRLQVWQSSGTGREANLTVCVRDRNNGGCLTSRSSDSANTWAVSNDPNKLSDPNQAAEALSVIFSPVSSSIEENIYIKLGENINLDDQTFNQGSIYRIPIVQDSEPPRIDGDITVFDPSGRNQLDLRNNAQVVLDGSTMYAGFDGVKLGFNITDQQGTGTSTNVATASSPSSGLDHVSLKFPNRICNTVQDAIEGQNTLSLSVDSLGSQCAPGGINSKAPKKLDLGNVSIVVTDKAGNSYISKSLASMKPFKEELPTAVSPGTQNIRYLQMINISTDLPIMLSVSAKGMKICSAAGNPCSIDSDQPTLVQSDSARVEYKLNNNTTQQVEWMKPFKPVLTYVITRTGDQKVMSGTTALDSPGSNDLNPDLRGQDAYTIKYSISLSQGGFVTDSTSSTGAGRSGGSGLLGQTTIYVTLDQTPPTVSISDMTKNSRTVTLPGGIKVLATSSDTGGVDAGPSTQARYTVNVLDKLQGGGTSANTGNVVDDQPGTSGVDWNRVELSYVRFDNLEQALQSIKDPNYQPNPGQEIKIPLKKPERQNGNLVANVTFADDGAYPVKFMKLSGADKAGNRFNELPLFEQTSQSLWSGIKPVYDMLVVEGSGNTHEATMTIQDDQGNPHSNDPYYHRGSVTAEVTVRDKWFAVAIRLSDQPFTGSIETQETVNEPFPSQLNREKFTQVRGSNDQWVYTYEMPKSQYDIRKRSVEGKYTLSFNYHPINGAVVKAGQSFGIDYSGPVLDGLRYSVTGPTKWGWIFSTQDERISLTGKDNLSGVADETVRFNGRWTGTQSEQPAQVSSENGAISAVFGQDALRLTLDGSGFQIEDKAGNASSILDLGQADSNLPEKTTGIVMVKSSPDLNVQYDNNSVLNGKYYKANRVATVTVTSHIFDFVKNNDKHRVMVDVKADGNKSELMVDKFDNPSGDGSTWVANMACNHDGDWIVDVNYTDPAGQRTSPYHAEFTIDTVKPVLQMTFDNTKSSSGMYFNAPRTAGLKQKERNFSLADTHVDISANDASGAAVAPPSLAGWSASGEQYTYTSSVAFKRELHYAITVKATDLAGNTAEEVKEPEFIIDMTSPKVAISQVADKTAYAGTVAPHIDFEDTNFDPGRVKIELTRTHESEVEKRLRKESGKKSSDKRETSKGYPVFTDSEEKNTPTSQSVVMPDFEHKVDIDDVYSLTAQVEDKAGNKAQQKVTFSVNRFGSNYLIDDSTVGILGKYVHIPPDVKITEINVSGLQDGKSHAELVHDSTSHPISADQDYRRVIDNTSGWQNTTYTFPARLFSEEGYYRLRLSSVDQAGNLSQNTMDRKDAQRKGAAEVNFAVDKDAPTASVAGLHNGLITYAPTRNLVVDAKDDVGLDSVRLQVDGVTVGSWRNDDTLAPMLYTMKSGGDLHDIELTVKDKAGNISTAQYHRVLQVSNWWSYMMARGLMLPILAVSIVLLAALVVAAVIFVGYRRRIAYRKNVFQR